MLANSALDHFAEPEDIAATVAFLGSDEAKSTTGALYLVDAGYTVA